MTRGLPGTDADASLVEAAARGDRSAFEQLVRPWSSRLYGFLCRTCGDRTDAEDLLQEVLTRAWTGLPGYRHRGRFAGWLFRIARNSAVDAGRRATLDLVRPTADLPETADPSGPHVELEARELASDLEQAIRTLPDRQREVFLLRLHSELTFREISDLIERPINTVLSDMHRAVRALRKAVSHAQ